jgi:hypothetical protein
MGMFREQGKQCIRFRTVLRKVIHVRIKQPHTHKSCHFENKADGSCRISLFDFLECCPGDAGAFCQLVLGPTPLFASQLNLSSEQSGSLRSVFRVGPRFWHLSLQNQMAIKICKAFKYDYHGSHCYIFESACQEKDHNNGQFGLKRGQI